MFPNTILNPARVPAGLLPGLALLLSLSGAAAQTAPPTTDACISARNGINGPIRESRSCASVVANGSYGAGRAAIGNGRASADIGPSEGGGAGGTDWLNGGWTNRALANSENGGIGWASSDLTTGRLRAAATTYVPPGQGGAQVFPFARMGDVLTLHNSSGHDQVVSFGYHFDGLFSDAGGSSWDYGYVTMGVASTSGLRFASSGEFLSGASMTSQFQADGAHWRQFFGGTEADHEFSQFGSPDDSEFGGRASLSFIVPPGSSDFVFSFVLSISCSVTNSTCDFGNTSSASFDPLPAGVSFTSQSGVFLTGLTAVTVPEPGTWALLLLPAGLLLAQRRRFARPCVDRP